MQAKELVRQAKEDAERKAREAKVKAARDAEVSYFLCYFPHGVFTGWATMLTVNGDVGEADQGRTGGCAATVADRRIVT